MLRMTSHNGSWTNNCFNLSDCDDEHSNNVPQEDARIGRREPRLTNRGPPQGSSGNCNLAVIVHVTVIYISLTATNVATI